nr:hypothetical protein [uncultured Rhodopila sp.]
MPLKIFFSWQADVPRKSGRDFIESALQTAVREVSGEIDIQEADRSPFAIDSDTRGVGGTPPIVDTIFKKIDAAAIVLVDLTLTGTRFDGKRRAPNPNVLIEYGWALKSVGHTRIVTIMNSAFSDSEDVLPFDLAHLRRPFEFKLSLDADEPTRTRVRKELAGFLSKAIRVIRDSGDLNDLLPKLPATVPFLANAPQDGPARYRPRGKRLGITDSIVTGGRDVLMQDGPAMWLRLMPAFDPGMRWTALDLRGAILAHLSPLGSFELNGYSPFRADDGFGTYSSLGKDEPAKASAILFDTGEVWTINTICLQGHQFIPLRTDYLSVALNDYLVLFRDTLGFDGELNWMVGFDGVLDRCLAFDNVKSPQILGTKAQCLTSTILFEDRYDKAASVADNIENCYRLVRTKCGFRL